jgi:hypothetical protein
MTGLVDEENRMLRVLPALASGLWTAAVVAAAVAWSLSGQLHHPPASPADLIAVFDRAP